MRQEWPGLRHRGFPQHLVDDAIVEMSAKDRAPDQGEIDSSAAAHGRSVMLTCGEIPNPKPSTQDDFFLERKAAKRPSCASTATFRKSDEDEDLNRRIFLGGLLLSTAIAMLLEAFVTGRTADRAGLSKPPVVPGTVHKQRY
jgi:hypothetical protein